MNILKGLVLLLLILLANISFAQDQNERLKLLNVHIGVGASNFINAEAPHKIISVNDDYYLLQGSGEPELNYETNFFDDVKYSFVGGLSFEYYLKRDVSLVATLNYESKGIDIQYKYKESQLETEPMWVVEEDYSFDVSNHYISLPLSVRKYLNSSHTFYVQGGCYLAYLLQSTVAINMEGSYKSSITNTLFELTNVESQNSNYGIELNEDDFDKKLTSSFDFGLVLGTGFNYPFSDQFYINADLSLCIGLKDIDKVNDNDYSEVEMPLSSGYGTSIRSANYYGLNSNAKNISGALTVGIGFRL